MPRRILLADDSVTAQNMGKKILSDAGYEVITVSNGSAALKKANELLPEIVVLDVYMPGYSGLEVCKLLRENRQTAEIPILLTVGKLEPFKSEEALKARANAFIVKPFEASELLAVIRKIEDSNAKATAKAAKPGKVNPMGKVFATSATTEEPDPDAGIEEKGWKNRLAMPSKAKAPVASEPEEEVVMGTGFRDLTPPAEDESLRRESAFTADEAEARVPEKDHAQPGAEAPLDISPEEIAAIKAAVEVLSGEGDRAPVLNVSAEGTPRQLAPEPEEAPQEGPVEVAARAVTPRIVEMAAVAAAPRWVAEAVELTQADAAALLEREMQEAQGTASPTETFNTYSLASFAESEVAEPVEDEPIFSEVAAREAAVAEAANVAQAKATEAKAVEARAVEAQRVAEAPVTAMAASASGEGNSSLSSVGTVSAAAAAGFQDLRAVASTAGTELAKESTEEGVVGAAVRDASAPEDEIDSRTKSQMDAAWSNWREIRNTIVTPNLTEQLAEAATNVELPAENGEAAMPDADSIASIVDSVLAEMRPKLLEEIARKLAAKKQ